MALREVVFGVEDGLVATLGLVTAVAAAHTDHLHVVVAGIAAAVANVVSMGVGSFISTRAQVDYERAEVHREWDEILDEPEREIAEARQTYTGYGFTDVEVDALVHRFQADKALWLEFMLRDRAGIIRGQEENPTRNAITMAFAVFLGSVLPVLPFLLPWTGTRPMLLAFGLSGVAAFALGLYKSRVAGGSGFHSGLAFLFAAGAAVAVGIGVGVVVSHWFGLGPSMVS